MVDFKKKLKKKPASKSPSRQPVNPPERSTTRSRPQQQGNRTLNKIGALWLGQGKTGKFMSGRIELSEGHEIRILVFKNDYKEDSRHPDYIIWEPENPQEQRNRSRAARDWKGGNDRQISDDDVPF